MSLTLIDMKQTAALTGLHHLYIRRMIRAKKFPAPVRIVGSRTRLFFNVKEVRAWIKTHAAWKADCVIRARDQHRHRAGVKIVRGKAVRRQGKGGTGPESIDPLPKPEPVDPNMPSQAERLAIKERLQARTRDGLETHRNDPGYAAAKIEARKD